jgi:NADPH:quinone reductase-like Zn-dependent oxidoreductase
MRAIQLEDYGGPEALKLVEIAKPQPGEGQVLVRVHAAGVNPADWKMGSGMYRNFMPLQFPWIPGLEGAGVIEAVGSGVTHFSPGQAVFGPFHASYAEYATPAVDELQLKPEKLSFEESASVPVGALTAWGAVIDAANVQPGQRVLVHGAAGGVGLYAVQLSRWKGAQVVGTASKANESFVRSLGAEAFDYSSGAFEQVIRDIDVVIDTVGGDLLERSLKVVRKAAVLMTIAGRPAEGFGQAQGARVVNVRRAPASELTKIRQLIETGVLQPAVYKVFPLAEARQAQDLSQTGHGRGRIVLRG